ncbi:MAG: Gfo/Idh/MocA family oxidoreductase [Chloroflexi bacterium]|nr:Gfo/Idh/MocA family oxidoreductase [Chloroflexota bacterium]
MANEDVRVSRGVAAEIAERWPLAGQRSRVGLIGCGRIARQHASVLTTHPATSLVAICDANPAALAGFGSTYGVPEDARFSDHRQMLDRVPLDIVHICTWPDTHAAITTAAAARGLHVYCEKPMALTLQEADAMLAACRRAGVVLGINHHRRGDSRFLRARQLIAGGALGTFRMLKGDHGGGGRRLMAMSTHLYDLFRYLAGDVAWVSGHVLAEGREATAADVYEIEHEGLAAGDEVAAQFAFRNGTYAFHNGLGHVDVELTGTHGRILLYEGAARKPWPFGDARAAWSCYPNGEGGRSGQQGSGEWEPLDGISYEELCHPQHAHRRMIDRFRRAVDGEGTPLCTGEDGRASLEMALALYASHFSGKRAYVPLSPPEHPLAPLWPGRKMANERLA